MTTIYLINNSLTVNNLNFTDKDTLEHKREKRILSVNGEKESEKLTLDENLKNTNRIYSSSYVMSLSTSKYLADFLNLDINIKDEIGERIVGQIGKMKIRTLNETQENDFNYKLPGGESLNEVKTRMLKFLNKILVEDEDKTISIFTHNVAITSLLSNYCDKGFNLDNRLILNYKGEAIIDGAWDSINIIELQFNKNELINISRKQ